jgi:hypothetical protein
VERLEGVKASNACAPRAGSILDGDEPVTAQIEQLAAEATTLRGRDRLAEARVLEAEWRALAAAALLPCPCGEAPHVVSPHEGREWNIWHHRFHLVEVPGRTFAIARDRWNALVGGIPAPSATAP